MFPITKQLSRRVLFALLLWISIPCLARVSTLRVLAQSPVAQRAPLSPNATAGEATTPEEQSVEMDEEERESNAYRHSTVVTRFGKMLGMGPVAASKFFLLVNLLILIAGVVYLLVKSLPKTFRGRTSVIQKHLVEARTATEEASARLNSVEDRLSKLDEQIAAMRAQSDKDMARDEQRIKANIEEEKAKIVTAAEQEIHAATTAAQRQLQQFAAQLAVEQAARKLVVTAETDRLLVHSFAQRLAGDKGGEN